MANELTHSKVISKTNSGFPSYLDFDKLRSASIEYLSKLTGKVWTDYNTHDPGITILEMLIYALLDLGYRTNLPAIDIFTRNPADSSPENNFFTPAEILTCNPLTITDFRKLLIDIDGVKNAWLTIADDIDLDSICKQQPDASTTVLPDNSTECKSYINGLYHICIEKDEPALVEEDVLLSNIKAALQSHRNLCEDFIDITFLCPLDIGVCADIAIDADADADEIYRHIIVSLQEFFSPSPVFYTLQQLLDKHKPIEDIFAGRPYNYKQSHGFVDTDELEAITLKNEIHLSDVYNIILSVSGVKTVRRLKLKKSGEDFSDAWQFELMHGYVPAFLTEISSFRFTSNGIDQPLSLSKSDAYLQLASANPVKLMQSQQPLDADIPKSVYHTDLADYYSIQNEFPLVYGIGEGGLPDSAPLQRKAQAHQLKAYLLFFDQLFAGYLSQLKNIRSLFSFRQPAAGDEHTYFTSELTNVPGFSDLIINIANEKGVSSSGTNGSILAFPVWKKDLETLLQQQSFRGKDIETLQQQFRCKTKNQRDVIISQLQNDFCNRLYSDPISKSTNDNLYFSYIGFSSEDVVVTTKCFSNKNDPDQSIQWLLNFASLPASYNSYSDGSLFVFNLQLHLPDYKQFIQEITENIDLYNTRRDAFLNHLSARFAERFTDYAMLSSGFLEKNKLTAAAIKNKEAFLSQYPVLSSMRGKAFDYRDNTENTSGFEQRVTAYAGIENDPGNSLCNFEIAHYDDTYSVELRLAGFHLFSTSKSYEGFTKAQSTAQAIFNSAADPALYGIKDVPQDEKFQLQILYNGNEIAWYPDLFNTKEDAEKLSQSLQKMFSLRIADEDVMVSRFEYKLQLKNGNDEMTRLSLAAFENPDDAFGASISLISTPSASDKWEIFIPGDNPSGKFCSNSKKKPERLVDLDHFKIDINNNITGKPDKFSYELLDKENTFSISSLNEFNNQNQAKTDRNRVLLLMTDIANYQLTRENRRNRLYITEEGKPVAECTNRLESETKAKDFRDKIYSIIRSHYYTLSAQAFPSRWKFTCRLGFEKNTMLLFVSNDEFASKEAATEAAEKFNASLPDVNLEVINNVYSLKTPDNRTGTLTCTNAGDEIIKEDNDTKLSQAKDFLILPQHINQRLQEAEKQPFDEGIQIDELSKTGNYVYRLVDKDRLLAQHLVANVNSAPDELNRLYNAMFTGYRMLSICLGGDVTESYSDVKTKATLYRYVIRCNREFGVFKKDTILFESVQTYASANDAETAFTTNYLLILGYASEQSNYGDGKYISLDEQTEAGLKNKYLVFIPKETQEIIKTNNADVVTTLVQAAKTYPVKSVLKCSDEFNSRFVTDKCEANANSDNKYVYYFALYNEQTNTEDWQSVKCYEQLTEARKDFSFFLMLLLYKGNYFIKTDFCNKQIIYIREVLAESTVRFSGDDDDVWGSAGVEKFICIAQAGNTINSAFNKNNSSYSFNIACNTTYANHPCKYNSAARRDEVIDKLYKSYKALDSDKLFKIIKDGDKELLYATDGKPVAILSKQNESSGTTDCTRIIDILSLAADDANYHNTDGKITLVKNTGGDTYLTLAEPADASMPRDEWKKQLLILAFYFPIKKEEKTYCVEIRLPGFNTTNDNKPCGCDNENLDNEDDCYVAWQSECCFNSCDEAMRKYESLLPLLNEYKNYHAYFDCDCYAFTIALLPADDIIAYNPQQYTTPDMVCEAVERAKKLINSEGLRLVEHILLRPRCEKDCSCQYEQREFANKTNCNNLFWTKETVEKGEDIETDICFVPGKDPYSFIATVVLPSWPQRFRKKENRDLLETVLNREIPSHILLRILWLRPKDICDFETIYKDWKLWLSQANDCDRSEVLCTFKNFLFSKEFTCLDECTDCLPCTDNVLVNTTCFDNNTDTNKSVEAYQRLHEINYLFGWEEFSCMPVTREMDGINNNTSIAGTLQTQPADTIGAVPEFKEMTPEEQELRAKKTRLVNGRLSQYKKNVSRIYDDSKGNAAAEKVLRVFGEENLSDKTNALLDELLSSQNLVDETSALHQSQKDDLCKNLVWFYIDKMLFNEAGVSKLSLIADGLNKLRQSNFDMQLLFTEWEPGKFSKYETAANIEAVRNIIVNG